MWWSLHSSNGWISVFWNCFRNGKRLSTHVPVIYIGSSNRWAFCCRCLNIAGAFL
jgi:hypothetical protein